MRKRRKNKKRLKLNNNLQTMRNVLEGDRIYHLMAQAMLSADTSVGGTVAMNYALGKLIAIYKQAMKGLGIDVEAYISDMTDWWSRKISEGADATATGRHDYRRGRLFNTPRQPDCYRGRGGRKIATGPEDDSRRNT